MLRSLPFASTLLIAARAVAVSLAALLAVEARADDLQVAADPTPVPPAPTLATTNAARPTQVPRPEAPATFTSHTTFYGWQNILVGELGLGTAIGTAMLDAAEAGSLGGLAYLFGGPSIHGLHDGGLGKVFGSLALNVGVPCMGAAIGALSAIDNDQDPGQNAAIGALIVVLLPEALRHLSTTFFASNTSLREMQDVIYTFILIAILIFAPKGVFALVAGWARGGRASGASS
jgi:hypothetical protein